MAPKKKSTSLTPEQQRKLLLTPCRTRQELKNWIKYFLGMDLPDTTVSRHATINPLDVVFQIYDICVNKNNPENYQEILYVASRGSGKCVLENTLILAETGPKAVQNVKIGDVVWTGKNWRQVSNTFDEGVKPGIKFTTSCFTKQGVDSLTGSPHHRIQACLDNGDIDWVHLRDLKLGQWIYRSAPPRPTISTSSSQFEDGWLIGSLAGDGCLSRHGRAIELCSEDFDLLRHYANLVYSRFGKTQQVKRNSKNSVTLHLADKSFRDWVDSYLSGSLSYDKALLTLEHSHDFLAGFITGLMDTDGSRDGITLANPVLVEQIGRILSVFGVHSAIDNARRPSRFSQFIKRNITYSSCEWHSRLPVFLMPLFKKREAFETFAVRMNEQFRFPRFLIKNFARDIKEKYEIANGYWRLNKSAKKTRSKIQYANDLWGRSRGNYIYGYKLDSFISLANQLGETDWAEKLSFIRQGFFETVSAIEHGEFKFFDLEVEKDHAYWSNGFISHNTLGAAIAEFMIMLHDQRDVAHVGAILQQAKRAYEYVQQFCVKPNVKPIIDPPGIPEADKILQKSTMERSVFNVNGEMVSMEVLPTTLKALNGVHCSLVSCDELDTLNGEGLRAIKEVAGMLDTKKGKKPLRIGISTRKSRSGLMNKMMENADKEGRHVECWTALEFTERCPDERSGTTPTDYWINVDKGEVLTHTEYAKLEDSKRRDFFLEKGMYDKCKTCPVAVYCRGDAKKQTSKSDMLKTIDELNQKIRSEGHEWAASQLFNLKPSSEGIVFKEFDENVHVKNWDEMWLQLTGKEFPGVCTHDLFVKKCLELGLSCYAGIDWGWTNPHTVVYLFVDSRENIYVVKCDGMTLISQPMWIHQLKTKYHNKYRCQLYAPDQADKGAVLEMQKAGLPVGNESAKPEINASIQTVKKFLRVPGLPNPKIFFARETCQPLINEFGIYHYKVNAAGVLTDDPEDSDNHWIDALRYCLYLLFGKTTIVLGGGLSLDATEGLQNPQGHYNRMPTPLEYAITQGIRVNQEAPDLSQLGKIGTSRELDKEASEDDDLVNGNASFLWSF